MLDNLRRRHGARCETRPEARGGKRPYARRPGRGGLAGATAVGAALALSGIASPANAQDARSGEVATQRLLPPPGADNFFATARLQLGDPGAVTFGAFVDWAHDPFRLRHCAPGACGDPGTTTSSVTVVRDEETANLLASYTLASFLALGVRLPIVHTSGDGVVTDTTSAGFGSGASGGLSATALGDPALELKARALGKDGGAFGLGFALAATAPIGHAMANGDFVGDGSPTLGVKAIVDGKVGRFVYGANVGGLFRQSMTLGSVALGSELRASAGAGVHLTEHLRIVVDVFGSSNFRGGAGNGAAEADGGIQWIAQRGLTFGVGGGAGLNDAVGVPTARVFASVGGVIPGTSRESTVPVVDDDIDHDGIPNADDRCPREGGDVVRLAGPYYGCPKRDSDEDGVLDHVDACPSVPGVATQDPKTNGCPSNDRDNDGIPNDKDKCPDQPETVNGYQDEDGCPDAPPAIIVEVHNDQIVVINEHINFEFNSDKIVGPRSFEALDLVARALKEHPEIKQLEVQGHTDNIGPRDENLSISKRRAAAVATYLVTKGVEPGRIRSNGYGPDKPVASNDTDEGRAQNRRVQFAILLMSK